MSDPNYDRHISTVFGRNGEPTAIGGVKKVVDDVRAEERERIYREVVGPLVEILERCDRQPKYLCSDTVLHQGHCDCLGEEIVFALATAKAQMESK